MVYGMYHKYKTNNQYCKHSNADDDTIGPAKRVHLQHRRWKNCPPAVFNLELIISILGGNVGVGNIILLRRK